MTPDDIASRLRSVRQELGYSQAKMAQALGISVGTVKATELGKNVPSGETLLKIAGLGFNPGWILTGEGSMQMGEPAGASEQSSASAQPAGAQMASIDEEWMGRVVDAIARTYKAEHISLSPADLGRLAAQKYREMIAAAVDPADEDERAALMELLKARLRKELKAAAAAPATRKRSA